MKNSKGVEVTSISLTYTQVARLWDLVAEFGTNEKEDREILSKLQGAETRLYHHGHNVSRLRKSK